MSKTIGLVVFLNAILSIAFAQESEPKNIVPNPGFEKYSAMPLGWFYTGRDFTRVVKYWESPTAASPDVYGPRVYVPTEWKNKGFAMTPAGGGKSMIGITVFGCEGGKPHCREYVQVQLVEPLVLGQRYGVRFKTNHLPRSIRIKDIGLAFVEAPVRTNLDERIDEHPWVEPDGIVSSESGKWINIEGEFYAGKPASYLLIGNFKTDEETLMATPEDAECLPFAYYYIDDVEVFKLPPILDVPDDPNDLVNQKLVEGKTITLNNIYFDHDSDEFLPRSFYELNTLARILKDNPSMRIEVRGHTDDIGTDDYNNQLALSRAYAVVEFLTLDGIEATRLSARGFGSDEPIASNDTDDGRRENRRVEFLIVAK